MEAEDEDDVFLGPAGRLIEAVRQFGGTVSPMSPVHAALHHQWRQLITQHIEVFGNPDNEGMSPPEVSAEEARMEQHMGVIDDLAEVMLAAQVQQWGDLLNYAEIAFWYQWAGVDCHSPDARPQMEAGPMSGGGAIDAAVSKLLTGVFTLAGIGHFARQEVRS